MSVSFRDFLGEKTLNEFLANWQSVRLSCDDLAFFNAPPPEFLDWTTSLAQWQFTEIPHQDSYKKQPSYLISQAHRLWITLQAILAVSKKNSTILDLGSFPFAIPVALRGYAGHEGDIFASYIQSLDQESISVLESYRIKPITVDLDPHVIGEGTHSADVPAKIPLPDGSVDVIVLAHVIEHLYHPVNILMETLRVLRPDGRVIICTDNIFMAWTFLHYVSGNRFLFEPVLGTCSVLTHAWRGHVKFWSAGDLDDILLHVGFREVETKFEQCFYDVFFADYFKEPTPQVPGFMLEMLKEVPSTRNEVIAIARKGRIHE